MIYQTKQPSGRHGVLIKQFRWVIGKKFGFQTINHCTVKLGRKALGPRGWSLRFLRLSRRNHLWRIWALQCQTLPERSSKLGFLGQSQFHIWYKLLPMAVHFMNIGNNAGKSLDCPSLWRQLRRQCRIDTAFTQNVFQCEWWHDTRTQGWGKSNWICPNKSRHLATEKCLSRCLFFFGLSYFWRGKVRKKIDFLGFATQCCRLKFAPKIEPPDL